MVKDLPLCIAIDSVAITLFRSRSVRGFVGGAARDALRGTACTHRVRCRERTRCERSICGFDSQSRCFFFFEKKKKTDGQWVRSHSVKGLGWRIFFWEKPTCGIGVDQETKCVIQHHRLISSPLSKT